MAASDPKVCLECGQAKPLGEFPRNQSARDGHGSRCKPCHNKRNRERIKRLYGNTRHYHLKQRYGIGADEVEAMSQQQGGLCACCKTRPATQVDHDHKSGKVRGIVCLQCNAAMGALKDDVRLVWEAIHYLEEWRGEIPLSSMCDL